MLLPLLHGVHVPSSAGFLTDSSGTEAPCSEPAVGAATRAHVTPVLGRPVQPLGSGYKAVSCLPASLEPQPAHTAHPQGPT